ncbi:hypothetical protein IEQ34_004479 [Dendrobium chrysotoxum]|uniref:Uncharacterized protein n=1 Tax=Dendrobium chrysotoxum TaxID=161865 RepID=A0AAV7HFA0_DENCH|nr:hypothetical protein IEQ34_004479 [Dendrobium chrysotoxum]
MPPEFQWQQQHPYTHEASMMMLPSLGCKQRIHAMRFSKRFGIRESRAILVQKTRRPISLKQMMWKIKSLLKHFFSSSEGRKRFGCDSENYSRNFDDGFIKDLY